MIAIIGAMEQEVTAVKEYMTIESQGSLLTLPYYVGKIADKSVVLLQGGIGKVNTSVYLTLLFNKFDLISTVINVGSAGGLNLNQSVGDVVIASEVVHHDFDVSAFNHPIGKVPGIDTVTFKCDPFLVQTTKEILHETGMTAHVGLIASGDQFICKKEQVDNIKSNFNEAQCSEMEAATVGHVCYLFNKKFIITRSLSDVFGKGDSHFQFDEYLDKASIASAKLCYELLCKI